MGATDVSTSVLTPADHAHFLEHGYVIVRRVVTTAVAARAAAALEAARFEGNPGQPGYKPVRGEAVDACASERMRSAIRELFGPGYTYRGGYAGSDMPRPYEPDKRPTQPFAAHIDDDYPTLMPNHWAVASFLFLTQVRAGGGAFITFPGSAYRCRALAEADVERIKWLVQQAENSGPGVEVIAEPGDLLLFHHFGGHSGSTNWASPHTRHALLARHGPEERIVPGDKPFDTMTTIEKANSPRYLREHLADRVSFCPPIVLGDDVQRTLAGGFAAERCIAAQDSVRWGGAIAVLYVDAAQPMVLRCAETRDFANWHDRALLEVDAGRIVSVRHGAGSWKTSDGTPLWMVMLGVQRGEHDVELRVYTSPDRDEWRPAATLPNVAAAQHQRNTMWGSKTAIGCAMVMLARDADDRLDVRFGEAWEDLERWDGHATVFRLTDGRAIRDFAVHPVWGESEFGLVVRTDDGLAYARSKDHACFEAQPCTLITDAGAPPLQLRVLVRARRYWLVTYLREADGRARLFWGVIDWEREPVSLRELRDVDALRRALQIVGLM